MSIQRKKAQIAEQQNDQQEDEAMEEDMDVSEDEEGLWNLPE